MPDKSLAWVIPISNDEEVPSAVISGALLRKHLSSEPVVAFVSKCVNTETIRNLQNVFDQIILAPEAPECGKQDEKNILLLQTLKLNAFSSLLVVQAGTLVLRKFDKAFEAAASPLKNQESKWTIVAVTPNPLQYLEALRLLKHGQPFDLQFIYEAITLTSNGQNFASEEVVYSWSDLKYFNGLRVPLVQLNSELANFVLQQSNKGSIDGKLEMKGFWQKVVYSELKPVIKLLEVAEDWSNEENQNSWVAIVGMSCRFPNANSVDEYWEVLISGQNTAGPPPSNRLGKCDIDSKVRANFLKCPIDEFDAGFFGIPPSEVAITDPQARLLLEVSWEAFEDAGINPDKLRNSPVGIFYGSWQQQYLDLINMTQPPKQDVIRKYVGNGFACAASKLSFFYGFTGPNIATESGCSSSLGAVELACQSLQLQKCSVALAAGANVILHLDPRVKVVLAADGVCKAFDSKANGFGKGEGVGVLVLKRYSDAIRDKDRIHGIIRGTASSQEGLSKSFGSPTVDNEANTMVKAMKAAGVSPTQVDYVEAHATGTRVGDPIEAEAIVKAYSSKKNREIPLWIGSGKTVIGHLESCSGIAGIIKVLLAMKHETIPPHINVETINPKVDFNSIPGKITLKSQHWKKSLARPRIAGVSNFGISGTAFHIIVQEPQEYLPAGSLLKDVQDAPLHILTLSSKTTVGLEQLSNSFLTFIEKAIEVGVKLEDIAYTAGACRAHHSFRRSVVGRNKEELLLQLREKLTTKLMDILNENLKIGFIFCDSLNQMDFEQYFVLYSMFPAFQIQMDFCDSVCNDISGVSPIECFLQKKLPLSTASISQQLCSFSVAYSLFKLWESWGVKADLVVGSNQVGELIEAVSKERLELHTAIKMITELKVCGDKLDEQEINSALAKFSNAGCNVIIEIGLGRCFPTSIQLTEDTLILPTIEGKGLAASLFTSLAVLYEAGYPIDWEGFYLQHQYSKVSLPHYPFQRTSAWLEGRKSLAYYPESATLIQNWKQVHPLLGNYASEREPSTNDNPSQTHTFESPLPLVLQHGPYLSHHVIGSELIFPASAYIEMLLAAYSFQGQDAQGLPITVENFKVDAPLRLTNKDFECGVRTIMTKSEPNATASKWGIIVEAKVNLEGENKSWKLHASGEVTGGHQQLNYESLKTQQCIVNLDEIKKRCVEKEQAALEFYHRLAQVGLNFGPNFKSLQTIYQSDKETLATVPIPQDAVHYVSHPLLSDAMIQCYMIHKHDNFTTLHVPVSIGKFVCYRRLTPWECSSSSTNLHIYFNEGEDSVFLLDSEGKTIATMTQLEIKATTVSSILSAAGLSKNEGDGPLDMWQVCWKPASGYQTSGSLNLMGSVKDFTQSPSYISLLKSLESRNRFTSREALLFKNVNRLCELYVLKAFYEMGWKPEINDSFQITQLAHHLKITEAFLPAFRHYLGYLVENGMLEENKITSVLTVKAVAESLENVEHSITEHLTSLSSYGPIQSLKAGGNALASVLQGRIKGQQILFVPVEKELTYADIMYKTNPFYGKARASVPVFIEVVSHQWKNCLAMKEKENNGERKLRILEVGGGTGVFTSKAISLLQEEAIDYSYHFTDISSAFLKKGESCFPNNFTFKIFNIEKDPLEQGFPPGYFDIVVGQDVLHSTKDLRVTLGNLKMLLKPGGNILIGETAKPVKDVDLTFGLIDGYWRFEDFDIRSTHCTISAEQWLVLLKECGFGGPSSKIHITENHYCTVVGTLSEPDEKSIKIKKDENKAKSWLLLHDLEDTKGFIEGVKNRLAYLGRNLRTLSLQEFQEVITSECDGLAGYLNACGNMEGILCFFNGVDDKLASDNCRSLLEPLLFVSKYMIGKGSWNTVPRMCVATSGLWKEFEGHVNPYSATLWGFVRCARMEAPWVTTKLVDLDPDEELDARVESLIQEIWMGDDETEAVYRAGIRYTRRLTKASSQTKDLLEIPTRTKDYTIKLPESNLLTDLLYIPKNIEELVDNEVVVEVRAVALNFRDVFSVLKPSDRFKNLDVMGMDFSGVVVKVGDDVKELQVGAPVFGICLTKSTISGYVSSPIQNLAVIPHGITFAEAATIPVAFFTAWYCLVDVANASLGQTVLIHAASGGVGLVAVQIANYLGLNIIATAGSQKKRNFLKSLGIINVFHSRTLEYGEQIKKITNGQGVDIVLNCLTGPGFKETSLEICKNGGSFVEISKLDIWEEGEVEKRKPGVKYTIVDLTIVEPIVITNMLKELSRLLAAGSLKPLPFTRFTASRIVSALQFLQKAKHIGKVIVEMPKFDVERKKFRDMLFNDRSTYLITGGKGAIGLAIAEWMVSQGAKYLVLLGRGPPKENVLDIIHKLREEDGAKISCMEADVADVHQLKRVFQDIEADPNLPPLRGIHHCAGVLSDKMIASQNWENFEDVLNPKVKGAYNLHSLTLQTPLEFFVLHSSVACTIGNFGQSNYAAANLYMEALIDKRVSNGLPGTSISWGHWNAGLSENIEVEVLEIFSMQKGIDALEKILLENIKSIAAAFFNPQKIAVLFLPYEKTFLKNILVESVDTGGSGTDIEMETSLLEAYSKAERSEEKESLVRNLVIKKLSDTLGVAPQDVSENVKFSRMGLDSLLSIEFYNKLQSQLGEIDLGHIDMEEYGTVPKITCIIRAALDNTLV